jgi:hypothetical protein
LSKYCEESFFSLQSSEILSEKSIQSKYFATTNILSSMEMKEKNVALRAIQKKSETPKANGSLSKVSNEFFFLLFERKLIGSKKFCWITRLGFKTLSVYFLHFKA